jgi:hypothetical protein
MAKEAVVESAPDTVGAVSTRKFRVLHGAVGGVKRTPEGKKQAHDYTQGEIVDEHQLDGNAPFYFSMGAIEIAE